MTKAPSKSPYDNAVDYVRGRVSVSAPNLARDCQITPGTARSWLRMMERDGVVAEANDIGRHLVLKPMPAVTIELPDALNNYQTVLDAAAAESARIMETIREGAPNLDDTDKPSAQQTKSRARHLIEAMLRLKAEADEITTHLAEVRKAAKDEGHHVKALNAIVHRLRQGPHKHAELEAAIDLYVAQFRAEGAFPELEDMRPAPVFNDPDLIETHH